MSKMRSDKYTSESKNTTDPHKPDTNHISVDGRKQMGTGWQIFEQNSRSKCSILS